MNFLLRLLALIPSIFRIWEVFQEKQPEPMPIPDPKPGPAPVPPVPPPPKPDPEPAPVIEWNRYEVKELKSSKNGSLRFGIRGLNTRDVKDKTVIFWMEGTDNGKDCNLHYRLYPGESRFKAQRDGASYEKNHRQSTVFLPGQKYWIEVDWDEDTAELHIMDGLRYIAAYRVEMGGGFVPSEIVVGNHAFRGYDALSDNIRVFDVEYK